MDRGWNDPGSCGLERSRLGQQPYDRGRLMPVEPRCCFECGHEGHIARFCPVRTERIQAGFYRGWPNEQWPPARPPLPFHRDGSYSRGENARDNSYSRRTGFDCYEQDDYYHKPRDTGGRTREDRGMDRDGASDGNNSRERESRSSRSSGRKPQDVTSQSSGGHRRDDYKPGKEDRRDDRKDGKRQRLDTHGEPKNWNAFVPREENGEGTHQGRSHSEVDTVRKDGHPAVGNVSKSSSTKETDHQKADCKPIENGGKRGHRSSKAESSRNVDTGSSRAHHKIPLSVLCTKAAMENGAGGVQDETRARKPRASGFSPAGKETSLPKCSASGEREKPKSELPLDRKDADVTSSVSRQDSKELVKNEKSESDPCTGVVVVVTDPDALRPQRVSGASDDPESQKADEERQVVKASDGSESQKLDEKGKSVKSPECPKTGNVDENSIQIVDPCPDSEGFVERNIAVEKVSDLPLAVVKASASADILPSASEDTQLKSSDGKGAAVEASISADFKPSASEETQSKSSHERRTSRWDNPEDLSSAKAPQNADLPKNESSEASGVDVVDDVGASRNGNLKTGDELTLPDEDSTVPLVVSHQSDTLIPGKDAAEQPQILEPQPPSCNQNDEDSVKRGPDHVTSEPVSREPANDGKLQPDCVVVSDEPANDGKLRQDCVTSEPVSGELAKDGKLRQHCITSEPVSGELASDGKRVPDCATSQAAPQQPGNDALGKEAETCMVQSDSGPSSRSRQRPQLSGKTYEPGWGEPDRGYDDRGRKSEAESHVHGFDRVSGKDPQRIHSDHGSLSPSRAGNGSRETDFQEGYRGFDNRALSVEGFFDRSGYAASGYAARPGYNPGLKILDYGLKPEYRRRFQVSDGRNGFGTLGSSEFRRSDDIRDHQGWGTGRHLRSLEAQSAYPEPRHPYAHLIGAHYLCVVNARAELQRSPSPMAISPPPAQATAVSQGPFPSSHVLYGSSSRNEVLSRGWVYIDRQGTYQGPLELGQLKEMQEIGMLQSDHLVCQEGSNEWVTLENARSPPKGSPVKKPLEDCSSSRIHEASPPAYPPFIRDGLEDDNPPLENEDCDICPPGTEVPRGNRLDGEQFEDLHIDERVEKLMQGFTYVPGKEGEAVYEALSSAAMRVRAALGYETDQLNEESPRSHGGFANLGDQWKDGDFGSDVQGLDASEQHVPKADDKVDEKSSEVVSEARTEISVAKAPPPVVHCKRHVPAEKKPEPWTWPARGGDWKLYVYPAENAQPVVGEKGPQVPMIARKVVLNGGHPFCETGTRDTREQRRRDPRRLRDLQIQAGDTFHHNSNVTKLEVPKFGHVLLLKGGTSPDVQPANLNHHLRVTTKVALLPENLTPLTSTPRTHPVPARTPVGGFSAGFKASKPRRPSSTLPSATGVGSKSRASELESEAGRGDAGKWQESSKRKMPILERSTIVSKYRAAIPRVGGATDGRLKPVVDRMMKHSASRAEAVLRNRSSNQQDSVKEEASKAAPKQLFSKKDLLSKETLNLNQGKWFYLDGTGTEVGPFAFGEIQELTSAGKLVEGSTVYRKSDDTWVHVSKSSVGALGADASIASEDGLKSSLVSGAKSRVPESSVVVDRSRHCPPEPVPPAVTRSGNSLGTPLPKDSEAAERDVMSDLSFHDVHPQFLGFTRGKLHEYAMKNYKSALLPAALYEGLEKWFQAKEKEKSVVPPPVPQSPFSGLPTSGMERSSTQGTPSSSNDDAARMVESEALSRATSVGQDEKGAGEILSPSKRRAWGLEESKLHRRDSQRRRLLDLEEGGGEEKASRGTVLGAPSLPRLVDDSPFKTPAEHLIPGSQGESWATLDSIILRMIFRRLPRGDVTSLVNATATCKSWMAAGNLCRTQLKSLDLSSLRGAKLDALISAIPGFGASNLRRVNLSGCTDVKPESLAELLATCPSITVVETDSLELFKELKGRFPKVRWVTDRSGPRKEAKLTVTKRDDAHVRRKSLKAPGGRKSGDTREYEDFDSHLVSDSASKVRSPTGYAHNLSGKLETTGNYSVHDPEYSGTTRVSDPARQSKLTNGGKKLEVSSSYSKAIRRETGDSISHELHVRRKTQTSALHRKHEKSNKKEKVLAGSHRPTQEKASVTSLKSEFGTILRAMMEADPSRIFQQASGSFDVKGGAATPRKMDLLVMEKKLRGGSYSGGKKGIKAFREDVNLLTRIAFRNSSKDSLIYTTAERIFKVSHSYLLAVENQFSGQSTVETQSQGKSLEARPFGRGDRPPRSKASTPLLQRPGTKRKVWNDEGYHKGKLWSARKSRQGDWSEIESETDSERDTRRLSKSKKERFWGSDDEESSEDDEDRLTEGDEEQTETEPSDSEVPSESEGEDNLYEADSYDSDSEHEMEYHEWGARMTKAAMVPPVTRKYDVIEEYRIVADKERVEKMMKVELPKNVPQAPVGSEPYNHLDYPEVKDYQPRKKLGEEVLEQEVYGIDPYTHNLLLDTMPLDTDYSDAQKQQFIEERLLMVLNKEGKQFTGSGRAPMEYPLERVVQRIASEAQISKDWALYDFAEQLLSNMQARRNRFKFVAYRKGLGVVCNKSQGLEKDEFVVEFFGEVYPPWRWYEKQDGIRSLQKGDKDPTPEFYNIYYERPKADVQGYDLLVVDAMHKANFASRLCHSCRPNCEAKITAVNNRYIIGVYTLRPIKRGEELTFDYNSVTESKEEFENARCLCGTQGCKGSYLNLTGSGTYEQVITKDHGILDRHRLLLSSCSSSAITDKEMEEMRLSGFGASALAGLPQWALKYTSNLVRFMNHEKASLPGELSKDPEHRRVLGMFESASAQAEFTDITTDGVYNQRLQNLTITLDKVRHILTELYREPSAAPPPVRKLDPREMVQWIWKKQNSVVNELVQSLAPHLKSEALMEFKAAIGRNSPNDNGVNLHMALLWLRDALRRLPASCNARHDAAADLIHLYAYTRHFFVLEDYGVVTSPPVLITPLDLGTKHSITEDTQWRKVYGKDYVWGQLINWFKQNVVDPGSSLAKSAHGCLVLPDISSCYSRNPQHDLQRGYGPKARDKMIQHMENKPQQKWPKLKVWSQFWCFKNERGLFGSPMLDAVVDGRPLREDMMRWLKLREINYVGRWDEQ
ncbi:hypothetical protein R1sor_011985 [Riccia sorocarpa]|uniref:CCHC-type domain-containing protein n=1 Tax=Riccia sorocarpa TaxID=122646 RepID=A0ABD3I8M3_9MARC